MTITGSTSASSYLSSLVSSSKTSATATSSTSDTDNDGDGGVQSTQSRPPRPPQGGRGPDEATRKAAEAKLSQTDPTLAKKMQDFQKQMESLKKSGASADDIKSAMKTNMESLSSTEKSELKSIFGNPPGQSSQQSSVNTQA